MGLFKYIKRCGIESELEEQRFLFDELLKEDIEKFHQETHTLQEIEEHYRQFEMKFREWFIQCYIIPKYFTKSISPWI